MNKSIFMRIDQLMKHQNKKIKDLNDYLGLKQSTYDNWKRGKSESYLKHIDRIAEYLNVTPNYLICGSDSVEKAEDRHKMMEDRLVNMFRSISDKDAEVLMKIVYAFVSSVTNPQLDIV